MATGKKRCRYPHHHNGIPATVAPLFSPSSKSTAFTRATNCDIPVDSDLWLLPVDAIGGLAGSTSASKATPARPCPFRAESSLPPRKAPAFLWFGVLPTGGAGESCALGLMVDFCACHGPAKLPAAAVLLAGARVASVTGRWWWRPAAAVGARHGVAARASSFSSRIGLDSQVRCVPSSLLAFRRTVGERLQASFWRPLVRLPFLSDHRRSFDELLTTRIYSPCRLWSSLIQEATNELLKFSFLFVSIYNVLRIIRFDESD